MHIYMQHMREGDYEREGREEEKGREKEGNRIHVTGKQKRNLL